MILNKILWLNPWLCDLLIVLKRKSILFVEMKKSRGKKGWLNWSTISPEQVDWIEALNDVDNVSAVIAHWYLEAIAKVEEAESI
jgi:hypothetical protein